MDVVAHLGVLVILLAAVAASLVFGRAYSRRKQAERKSLAVRMWVNFQQTKVRSHSQGFRMLQVIQVYQRARFGSKAIIVWCDSGLQQDTWFEGWQAMPGAYMLVRPNSGWGPHNRNPAVLYVKEASRQTWISQETAWLATASA
ncbi:hypothetical protein V2S66_22190 [Streptomyces sp. V4-01]|uniref:DUF2550 family protein n=1 Tax=Actinacidiphila polyblastidii TaxID=3110430 RepID=A0ABU7PFU8_9ACTN|nr:hypothetical protein [Streptomyces sp. V4-01]